MNGTSKKPADLSAPDGSVPLAAATQGNRIIVSTMCSVLLSVALAVSVLTPVLIAAALAPFFYAAMKRGDLRNAFNFAYRWGVFLYVCVCVLAVFLPDRTAESFPLAGRCIGAVAAWVSGAETSVPFGPVPLAVGIAGIALVSLLSGGMGAIVIGAGVLGCAACTFAFLVRHGENILQMAAIGNLPWIIAFCAAGLFLLIPTALPFYRKLLGSPPAARYARTYAIIGASLALAGIACALLFGGAWQQLLHNYTVW